MKSKENNREEVKPSVRGQENYGLALVIVTAVLIIFGLYMVYSASYVGVPSASGEITPPWYYLLKQVSSLIIGLFLAFLFYLLAQMQPANRNKVIIILVVVSTLAILFAYTFGPSLNGSRRWIQILPFLNIQPSEFLKIALVLFAGMVLAKPRKKPLLLFMLFMIFPVLVAVENLSTGLLMAASVFVMFLFYGITKKQILAIMGTILGGGAIFVALEPYRLGRLTNYLGVLINPLKADYQVKQSLYALANGGFIGQGITNSKQKFFHLPEHHTDFIFAIIGEELGLIGEIFVLGLFFIFIYLIFKIALNSQDKFKRFSCLGFGTLIGAQILLNIGVVSGAFPVTGVTLPFISYGGSSLMSTLAIVGFVLGVSELKKRRKHGEKRK